MATNSSEVVRCFRPGCRRAIIAVWSGTCYGAQCGMCQVMVCEGTCGGVGHEEPTATCKGRPIQKFKNEAELRANKIEETKRYLRILALMQEEVDKVHVELEPLMLLLADRLNLNILGGNRVPPGANVTQEHWDVMFEHEKLQKMMTSDEIGIDGPTIQLATNYKTYIRKNKVRLQEQLIAIQQDKWQPTKEAWAHRSHEPGYTEGVAEDVDVELGSAAMEAQFVRTRVFC